MTRGEGHSSAAAALVFAGVLGAALVSSDVAAGGPGEEALSAAVSSNAFGLDLYAKLRGEPGNIFFSPASISTALAMLYSGARGGTADEMKKVLHLESEEQVVRKGFGSLAKILKTKSKGSTLSLANAFWIRKDITVAKLFLGALKGSYGAAPRKADFVGASGKMVKTINDWVAKQTQKKIKEIVTEDTIKPETLFALVNAIYFKGFWKEQFDPKDTEDAPFWVTPSQSVNVDMMFIGGEEFRAGKGGGFTALEMPYKGGKFAMLIILPDAKDGLAMVEKNLTAESIAKLSNSMSEHTTDVYLPRFSIEAEIPLADRLKAMGMPSVFGDKADLSGMAEGVPLSVSAAIHKAYVEVNEKGTEAAAATAIVGVGGGILSSFRADHPFLFLIRHTGTGAILFMGRLVAPTAS